MNVKQSGRVAAYLELTKPRVTLLTVSTTAFGFYLASIDTLELSLLFHTLLGTVMLVGGTSVLNQFLERETDAKMHRTEQRPLPSGRLKAENAMLFGLVLGVAGVLYLAVRTNLLTAFLGCLAAVAYLFVYTPLKTRTPWCTLVGAFPGAIPPLLGWAAARGDLDFDAWALFAILFLWQFPHFLAISWLYREDYRRGGFSMGPLVDLDGRKTSSRIIVYCLVLLPVSLVPWISRLAGFTYLFGALILGLMFLAFGIEAAFSRTKMSARRLLRASVVYLPLLLFLMALDKV
jgi:protoheme IX farnesyltransferase